MGSRTGVMGRQQGNNILLSLFIVLLPHSRAIFIKSNVFSGEMDGVLLVSPVDKTIFKCQVYLTHSDTEVDIEHSSANCVNILSRLQIEHRAEDACCQKFAGNTDCIALCALEAQIMDLEGELCITLAALGTPCEPPADELTGKPAETTQQMVETTTKTVYQTTNLPAEATHDAIELSTNTGHIETTNPSEEIQHTVEPTTNVGPSEEIHKTIEPTTNVGPSEEIKKAVEPTTNVGPSEEIHKTVEPTTNVGPSEEIHKTVELTTRGGPSEEIHKTVEPTTNVGNLGTGQPGNGAYTADLTPTQYDMTTPKPAEKTHETIKSVTEAGHKTTGKPTNTTHEEKKAITTADTIASLKSTLKSFLATNTEAILDTTKAQSPTETICTSNAESKTGFKFFLCLELQTESLRNLRTVKNAFVHHSTKISSRPDVSIDSTNNLVNLTEFQSVTSLTSALRDHIVENLVVDLAKFVRHEESAEQQRFKRRWVQSNLFTDRLARDSRLLETVASSVHDSLETGSQRTGDSHGHDNSVTQDMLLSGLRESCVLGHEGFYGGHGGGDSSPPCDSSEPGDIFRRVDGVCNNLNNRHWGAAGIPMRRLLPAAYGDGFSTPRVLPPHAGPRDVSNGLHATTGTGPLSEKGFSHMAMQFGQFLDHDITITPQAELDCCNTTFLALDQALPPALQRCLNIPITNDTFPNLSCFSFTRSDTICATNASLPREQFNGLTAFIDGSNIYGSDADTSSKLRQLSQGLLKTHDDASFTAENLPQRSQCPFPSPPPEDDLTAGDVRAVATPTLASMHTLFLNEHNRISRSLEPLLASISTTFPTLPPDQQDEIVFQSTRRLVGAELQQIVYREYLPVVLGSALSAELTSATTTYNNNTDPSVMNEFATIAFRFGHSTVSSFFNGFFTWPLSAHFFDGDGQPFTTGPFGMRWQHEMTGASAQQAPAGDLAVVDALRNELFQNVNGVPDDLVARNLQRAREHGIPSYGALRTACGLEPLPASEPYTAPPEINQNTWQDLLDVYVKPANIDAFTGGLAETAPPDGLVGALFACIIRQQFLALRDGDRYFFSHQEDAAASTRSLGPVARENILQRSLAAVMCDNIPTLTDIQGRVFKLPAELNPKKPCTKFSKLDFECIAREFIGDILGEEILPCSNQTTTEPTKLSSSRSKTSISSSTVSEPPVFTPTASTLPTVSTLPTESTSSASTSSSSTSSSATSDPDSPSTAPLPGLCPKEDSVPVTIGVSWKDDAGCRDVQGNTYLEGQVLLSCCGCFRYTCTGQQEFSWTRALSPHCCQSCNGTVVTSGGVLSQSQTGDSCGTTVTATCTFHAEEDRAVIEEHYEYLNCCADGAGLAVLGTQIVDAGSCSRRTCERGQGRAQAAWVARQQVPGCTCCQHEGKVLQEGEEVVLYPNTLTCCKGQLLNKPS